MGAALPGFHGACKQMRVKLRLHGWVVRLLSGKEVSGCPVGLALKYALVEKSLGMRARSDVSVVGLGVRPLEDSGPFFQVTWLCALHC